MIDYEDLIFQAHSAIDILLSNFEDGGTLQSVSDDVVTMYLADDSETTINLAPIQRLLDALMNTIPKSSRTRRLPMALEHAQLGAVIADSESKRLRRKLAEYEHRDRVLDAFDSMQRDDLKAFREKKRAVELAARKRI